MKLTSTIISLTALFSFASAVNVAYNSTFDNPANILSSIACSNTLHKKKISLLNFPNIGGYEAVEGLNSAACGTCWQITFSLTHLSTYVLVIDQAKDGFRVSHTAMNTLTKGNTEHYRTIAAKATQVDETKCGLSA
jgi:hypothetical protein